MPPPISRSCGIGPSPGENAMSLPFQRAASIVRVTPAWSTVVVIVPEGAAAVAASALCAAAEALDGDAALRVKPSTMAAVAAASPASVGIARRNDRRCVTRKRRLRPCRSRSIPARSWVRIRSSSRVVSFMAVGLLACTGVGGADVRCDAAPPAGYTADARRYRGTDVPRSPATAAVRDLAPVATRVLDAPTPRATDGRGLRQDRHLGRASGAYRADDEQRPRPAAFALTRARRSARSQATTAARTPRSR